MLGDKVDGHWLVSSVLGNQSWQYCVHVGCVQILGSERWADVLLVKHEGEVSGVMKSQQQRVHGIPAGVNENLSV